MVNKIVRGGSIQNAETIINDDKLKIYLEKKGNDITDIIKEYFELFNISLTRENLKEIITDIWNNTEMVQPMFGPKAPLLPAKNKMALIYGLVFFYNIQKKASKRESEMVFYEVEGGKFQENSGNAKMPTFIDVTNKTSMDDFKEGERGLVAQNIINARTALETSARESSNKMKHLFDLTFILMNISDTNKEKFKNILTTRIADDTNGAFHNYMKIINDGVFGNDIIKHKGTHSSDFWFGIEPVDPKIFIRRGGKKTRKNKKPKKKTKRKVRRGKRTRRR